jgi:tetratricopeptide (TPR) repeat protein
MATPRVRRLLPLHASPFPALTPLNITIAVCSSVRLQALEAYGEPTCEEAAAAARAALAISPICPEAYNVLALSEASSYEEALQLYRKAEELGPQVCYMLVTFVYDLLCES